MGSRITAGALTLGVAAVLLAPASSVIGQEASPPALASQFPFCSWWVETSTQNSNVAFPDTSAAYWTTPFVLDPSTTIQLQGIFTDGRYYSIQVYDGSGQAAGQVYTSTSGATSSPSVPNYMTDFDLVPDVGSVNPFTAGVYPASVNSYTVTVSATQGTAANWIPMPAATSATGTGRLGMLMLRAYLPDNPPVNGQSPLSGIDVTSDPPFSLLAQDLPTVSVTSASGQTTTLETCNVPDAERLMTSTEAGVALAAAIAGDATLSDNDPCPEVVGADSSATCVPRLEFFRTTSGQTPFPNGNSAYVAAKYVLPPGQALVVQALLPSTPWSSGNGSEVMSWPATSTGQDPSWNLRYFSLCNYVHRPPFPVVSVASRGGTEWGCANDVEIHDAMGSATRVLGVVTRIADRPTTIAKAGSAGTSFVWLPASRESADAEMLISVRNMLPSPEFAQAANNIPKSLDPLSASATMGHYYPSASMCDVRLLERSGVLRCTAVHRALTNCSKINGLNETPSGTLQRDGSVRADVRGNAPAVAKAVQACVSELLTVRGQVKHQDGRTLRHESGCLIRRGADCRGLDLRGARLQGEDLTGARLSFSHLGRADLSGAQLGRTKAAGANLSGTDLSGVQARGAELAQANWSSTDASDANLSRSNLAASVITSSDLSGADLSGASLAGTVVTGSDLTTADLSGADLTNAVVTNVDLTGAQVQGAVLSGATAQDITTPSGVRCSGALSDCLAR